MDDFIFLTKENAAEQDEAGNWQDIGPTKRKVFAKAQSPNRSEFFGAMQAGYETALVFELSAWDYAGEAIVEYQGARYLVKKTYRKSLDIIELSCERGAD